MYNETLENFANAAVNKSRFLRESKLSYLVSSALAGSFIGTGAIASNTAGALLSAANSPFTKILMGIAFTIALTLVIFTGTELFTGNNYVMTIGKLKNKVSTSELVNVWIYSWIGNLIGAIILSAFFVWSGLVGKSPSMDFFGSVAQAKATIPTVQLFFRAILCNFIVCLTLVVAGRTKNDAAKIILTIMCLFTFVVAGYEHSIANMTVFGIALFAKNITTITFGQALYALITATIGNIIGGAIFVGFTTYALRKS